MKCFDWYFQMKDLGLRFGSYQDFSFMQKYFSPSTESLIFSRALHFGEHLPHKIRLFLELLLDSLLTNDYPFSDKVKRKILAIMDDTGKLQYLECAFLAKKVFVKFQLNGEFGAVTQARLGNLEFFLRNIFET